MEKMLAGRRKGSYRLGEGERTKQGKVETHTINAEKCVQCSKARENFRRQATSTLPFRLQGREYDAKVAKGKKGSEQPDISY